MKIITEKEVEEKFRKALIEANFSLREDIKEYFNRLKNKLKNDEQREIVNFFIENYNLAEKEYRPLCQDTGYVEVYIELGNRVIIDFDIKKTIERITTEVYEKFYLRKSLINPITKENTSTNTPVFFNFELFEGENLNIHILIKGGGSENASKTLLLLPSLTRKEIEESIIDCFKSIGAKSCPPYIAGICIGGNLEKALTISKRLLLYKIDENPMNELEEEIAKSLKTSINSLNIGFQGLGFGETLIDLKLKIIPSHIATLPVAISVGCNSVRQASLTL